MSSVRFYAIAIDEVRDIFRATGETSTILRTVAAQRFGEPAVAARGGLLGKLGPVFRRQPDAPVVRTDLPSGSDVDTLLGGRHVPPHRLTACWALLEAWLDHLSWGTLGQELGEDRLDDLDFDLVRAEVPARHAVRHLFTSDLGIALIPCPGLAAGWARLEHVRAMADAWRPAIDRLAANNQQTAAGILAWLDQYPGWVDDAAAVRRPPPDLVVIRSA